MDEEGGKHRGVPWSGVIAAGIFYGLGWGFTIHLILSPPSRWIKWTCVVGWLSFVVLSHWWFYVRTKRS